ncbi:carbohydrate ABC transporter permease [Schaalia hyovaginalis]|uniref:Raffinose/stachyose/melibiose transport system permease protein n=1 Tax=Schaalia hyovaginalis TaxID=29316 RepID=A0A923E3S6_9ACTO|nr:carbohydrate ABC transporter permease [Schaalia hyovaginalis]MBB6334338.1 raffinose/stachyose/melibiose transport system permease protein [Schaalia hyovaginalis]MDY2668804.1 carbohydrate ABC transporter permease [Schaalia hyovaginalis]
MSAVTASAIPNKTRSNPVGKAVLYLVLVALTLVFIGPLLFILNNSFKGRFFISDDPFALPLSEYWVGVENYINGLNTTNFFAAAGWSFFITIGSVIVIVFFCAMTAYYITRVKTWWTNALYLLFVFSMVVPFQMVMFPTVKIADMLHLDNPLGMILLYLGFGAGLSTFIFSGFVKSIPVEIEEASMIDGCGPLQNYFRIVMPMLKPVMITVAILNAMWVWNDYLLPYLIIGLSTPYKTIPVVVQQLVGSHGSNDMGALMAMLVLAIIPIVAFYLSSQKYIIEGVVAGAVKG